MSDVKITISAKDNASAVFANVRSNLDAVQRSAAVLGSALGFIGVAGIGGLVAIGRNALDSVDAFNDLKDATGASIENISALDDVAARTGTSFETVQTALVKFNGALKDAKPGSQAEQAIKALGLSVQELKSLDPADALLKTSQALAGFADDSNKARLTQELFGKSLKEVAPFLKDLAETGALNAKVTTEQAEAAERFNKELFNLQKNATDAGRSMSIGLIETINESIALFRAGAKEGKSFYQTIRDEQLRMLGLNDGTKEWAQRLSDVNARLSAGHPSLETRNKLIKEQAELTTKLIKAGVPQAGGGRGVVSPEPIDPRVSVGDIPEAIKKEKKPQAEQLTEAQRNLAAYVKGLEGLLTTTEKLGEKQKALDFLKSIGTTGDIAQVRELVLGQAELVDTLRAQEEARKRSDAYFETIKKEQQALEESNKTLSDHIEEIGLTTAALDALRIKRLDEAIATQEQSAAQLNLQNSSEEEIAQAQRKIALLKEQRSLTLGAQVAQAGADTKAEQEKTAKEFADTLHNDLKGAFSTAFRDTSGEPLQAFGNAIANVIYSRAATSLAESFIGAAGGTGGGSILSKIFSFDGGGYTGPGARAGGLDGKGGFMAMLHPNETVLDHTRGQSSGGNVTVVQNFTVGDVASVSMVRAAVARSEQRIAGAMARSRTYGGALS